MKKGRTSLFSNLFGKKPDELKKETPVVISSYSQPHVLQYRMKEEGLTHDQKVLATLSRVRLESNFGKMVLYFCPMESMNITKQLQPGDGGSLPTEVIVNGLAVPEDMKPGLYTLKNVEVHSNGTMSVTATAKTEWEAV